MASVEEFLAEHSIVGHFQPYCIFSRQDDTLTAYFRGDEYFSERLTAHATIFRAFGSCEIVGCRIKGVSEISSHLPNHIDVKTPDCRLRVAFQAVRQSESTPEVASTLEDLDNLAANSELETVEVG